MHSNDLFLKQFTKQVDIRLFTPLLYKFFVDYLSVEKVRPYNGQYVVNTFIPPFPSLALERFMKTFFAGDISARTQAVDLAVTNACIFNCWHCYNAGRAVDDLPAETLINIVERLQDLGAMVINFTGGEPCLRPDLAEICSALRPDSCGILATTGYGFSDDLARRLRQTGVYSVSISLDSSDENEHDKKRGVPGAFRIALKGIETAKKHGFYTYTCAVPGKALLEEDAFGHLVELNRSLGVSELQLIEPAPAGRIVSASLDFGEAEFAKVLEYMKRYNAEDDGPAITSFAHMESPECFGCGAGQSHIYIDGTGEVSPCNMIPISYGNAAQEDLEAILDRMQAVFAQPYRTCLAHSMQGFFTSHCKKRKPVPSTTIPEPPVPNGTELPRFFQLMVPDRKETSGAEEIIAGYSAASGTYDDYWLNIAAGPIHEMFDALRLPPGGKAIDCGCGTGFSTAKLAVGVGPTGSVVGIDLTEAMVKKARDRMERLGLNNVGFMVGDVIEQLRQIPSGTFDAAVLTWLIGYVGCDEIFPELARVLKPGGVVGLVAHLDRSPEVPIEVFEEIIREQPDALVKAVQMKFPRDVRETEEQIRRAGLESEFLAEGGFDFVCKSGYGVYDHVMKSGAGATLYYALDPARREELAAEFVRRIDSRFAGRRAITIGHKYVVGIARTAQSSSESAFSSTGCRGNVNVKVVPLPGADSTLIRPK